MNIKTRLVCRFVLLDSMVMLCRKNAKIANSDARLVLQTQTALLASLLLTNFRQRQETASASTVRICSTMFV